MTIYCWTCLQPSVETWLVPSRRHLCVLGDHAVGAAIDVGPDAGRRERRVISGMGAMTAMINGLQGKLKPESNI